MFGVAPRRLHPLWYDSRIPHFPLKKAVRYPIRRVGVVVTFMVSALTGPCESIAGRAW